MCVVETKDSEQANHMKNILEAKYDNLTITSIGVAMGVEDGSNTDGETDTDSDVGDENEKDAFRSPSAMPRSPLPQRKSLDSFKNKAGGGLSIPIVGVNSGRRGSMLVQTLVKTPQWKTPDMSTNIDWSRRGTHYPVK